MHLFEELDDLHWRVNFEVVKLVLEVEADLELPEVLRRRQTFPLIALDLKVLDVCLSLILLLIGKK